MKENLPFSCLICLKLLEWTFNRYDKVGRSFLAFYSLFMNLIKCHDRSNTSEVHAHIWAPIISNWGHNRACAWLVFSLRFIYYTYSMVNCTVYMYCYMFLGQVRVHFPIPSLPADIAYAEQLQISYAMSFLYCPSYWSSSPKSATIWSKHIILWKQIRFVFWSTNPAVSTYTINQDAHCQCGSKYSKQILVCP